MSGAHTAVFKLAACSSFLFCLCYSLNCLKNLLLLLYGWIPSQGADWSKGDRIPLQGVPAGGEGDARPWGGWHRDAGDARRDAGGYRGGYHCLRGQELTLEQRPAVGKGDQGITVGNGGSSGCRAIKAALFAFCVVCLFFVFFYLNKSCCDWPRWDVSWLHNPQK